MLTKAVMEDKDAGGLARYVSVCVQPLASGIDDGTLFHLYVHQSADAEEDDLRALVGVKASRAMFQASRSGYRQPYKVFVSARKATDLSPSSPAS